MLLVNWNRVLNAFEKQNPRAYDYFYHFHCIHGLEENDLSPYECLRQILEHSGEATDIDECMKAAAFSCVPSLSNGSAEVGEEGVIIYPH